MTCRAVVLGVLGAMCIAAVGYLNDQILQLTYLVGNHFPIGVFGGLILFALVGNPVLRRVGLALRSSEMAVIVALLLTTCAIPGSTLMRLLPPGVVMPIHFNQMLPGWQAAKVLDYVPRQMLPGEGRYEQAVVNDFILGKGRAGRPIDVREVPWAQWAAPLATWGPLIVLFAVAAICLSMIVHRQWAWHERLRYPVADFASTIMAHEVPGEVAGRLAPIFRNRLFWIGLGVVLAIRVANGLYVWTESRTIEVSLYLDLMFVTDRFPILRSSPNATTLFKPVLYPTAFAFAYFLASDVGLSLGISQVLHTVVFLTLITFGVDMAANGVTGGPVPWEVFGASMGIALMVAYTGRHYYWRVLRSAVAPLGRTAGAGKPRDGREADASAVWACRVFLASMAALVVLLVRLGLPWPFAVLTVGLVMTSFLVHSRVNAEGGLFYFALNWQPTAVLCGLFGFAALGPSALIIVGLLCMVLTLDTRESIMPFMVNALKIADDARVKPGRVGWPAIGLFTAGFALAVPVVLWAIYNYGAPQWDRWAQVQVPTSTFDAAERMVNQLNFSDQLQQSHAFTPLERLSHMRPSGPFLWSAGLGLVLVLVFSALRLRLPWWPIHPVIFLVAGNITLARFAPSFFLGWLVKSVVTGVGGGSMYRKVKPLMVGAIAGDLLGGMVFMAYGAWYHWTVGLPPKVYMIFPQ